MIFEPISKFIIEIFDIRKKSADNILSTTGIYVPESKKEEIEEFSLAKVVACPLVPGERVKHIEIGDHILVETNFVETLKVPVLNKNEDLVDFSIINVVDQAAIILKVSKHESLRRWAAIDFEQLQKLGAK